MGLASVAPDPASLTPPAGRTRGRDAARPSGTVHAKSCRRYWKSSTTSPRHLVAKSKGWKPASVAKFAGCSTSLPRCRRIRPAECSPTRPSDPALALAGPIRQVFSVVESCWQGLADGHSGNGIGGAWFERPGETDGQLASQCDLSGRAVRAAPYGRRIVGGQASYREEACRAACHGEFDFGRRTGCPVPSRSRRSWRLLDC